MREFKREDIKCLLQPMVEKLYIASQNKKKNLYKNTLDCFSAVFEASVLGLTLEEWQILETQRQQQKTMQNSIGNFHQKLLGTIDGVEDLGANGGLDIRSEERKIVAEIKNKHNTVKGDNRSDLYKKMEKELGSENNQGFTAYLVEVLSRKGKRFDKEFTATESKPTGKKDKNGKEIRTKEKLEPNNKIRWIDIRSFYEKLGIDESAISELYKLIPELVTEILKENHKVEYNPDTIFSSKLFDDFFNQAYPKETFKKKNENQNK